MATKDRTALKDEFKNGNLATGERFADLIDSMKVVQEPVADPAASGTSLSFIDSISQDADGKITPTKKTLDLSNAHELNPFKGWWKTGDTLPTSGFDGAYLYFKDTDQTPAVTTIFRWNGTGYADTGVEVDESNVQTFETGQAVNGVKIMDENGEESPSAQGVLSAEAGVTLNRKIEGEFSESSQTITGESFITTNVVIRRDNSVANAGAANYLISTPTQTNSRIEIPDNIDSIEVVAHLNDIYYYGVVFLSSLTDSWSNSFISGLEQKTKPEGAGNVRNFYYKIEKNEIPQNAKYIVVTASNYYQSDFDNVYIKFNVKEVVTPGVEQELERLNEVQKGSLTSIEQLVPSDSVTFTYYPGYALNYRCFSVLKGDKIIIKSSSFPYLSTIKVVDPNNPSTVLEQYTRASSYDNVIIILNNDGDLYFSASASNTAKRVVKIRKYDYSYQDVRNIEDKIGAITVLDSDIKEVSKGIRTPIVKTSEAELDASSLISSNQSPYYTVGFHNVEQVNKLWANKKILVINHDDLALNDYECTRKQYEKFGYTANFSLIVSPFTNLSDKERKIDCVKKLIKSGNKLGLHAIFSSSFWSYNLLFDVRPDGSSTFAPKLSELKGSNPSGTGTNTFGEEIDNFTSLKTLQYVDLPSELDKTVVQLTEGDVNAATQYYVWYTNLKETTGFDLNDEEVTKNQLWWIEYWFNCLCENLGTSSTEANLSDRFEEDYEVPSGASVSDYYPEAENLLAGRVVFFDDTENSHYNEALVKTNTNFSSSSYQLVGRFKKGIYKGCCSTCNYEILDRVLWAVTEYLRYYYSIDTFVNYDMHGVRYVNKYWSDDYGYHFYDRNKTKLYFVTGESLYMSRLKGFSTIGNIFSAYGIRNMNSTSPNNAIIEGQSGMWFGQDGCIKDVFAKEVQVGDFLDYLMAVTPSSAQPSGPVYYNDLVSFMQGIDNWSKFIFENAGSTQTRNSKTYYIPDDIQKAFLRIISTIGTGKVPVFNVDTIVAKPNCQIAVELVLRFINALGMRVVDIETARQLCTSNGRDYKNNWFPNSKFNQTLLDYLGGSNNSFAQTPDGFVISEDASIDVINEIINDKTEKVLLIQEGSATTNIFGLQPGTYKFSFYAKSSLSSKVSVYLKKNSDKIRINDNVTPSCEFTINDNEYTLKECTFEIPEFEKVMDGNTNAHVMCEGYENNIGKVTIVFSSSDNELKVYNPKIELHAMA